MESLQRKGKAPTMANPGQEGVTRILEDLQNVHEQIQRVTEFQRSLYNSIQLMRETLERKGLMNMEDLKATEDLYRAQKTVKEAKIKELLSSTMTDIEKIEFCLKEFTDYKPGYEKFNLNPVKDLNVSPPVINEYLSQQGFSGNSYVRYAQLLGVPETMLMKDLCNASTPPPQPPSESPQA